jgi:RNA polymerase sigma-70 factor (ECF subfamily)
VDWVTTSTILRDLRDYANVSAWGRLVDRFRDPVVRFARRLGFPDEDAEDIAQETFLAFAEMLRGDRYDRERGRLRSWLFGIASKQALRQRERRARWDRPAAGPRADMAILSIPDEKTVVDLWNKEWEQFLVRECFRRVRVEYRPESVRAFDLVVREGWSAQEAAVEIGTDVKAVYNAKHRILKRMRELRAEIEDIE